MGIHKSCITRLLNRYKLTLNEHTSQTYQNTEVDLLCPQTQTKCSQTVQECYPTVLAVMSLLGTLAKLQLHCHLLLIAKCSSHVKCIQMSTECSHAIILQTIHHRGNNAERSVKNTLCQQGHVKGKQKRAE